ncbi:ribonuclease R [Breoghania sp.]|uniref:ribonuclease R n=1 Tax=Breoghania sp. TaxID=2065378 RepID=UPI0026254F31|nr:ribonuclease R [Breoghania sp.]MDJ0929880.1 ribonuclease R [Breoghania sp.]
MVSHKSRRRDDDLPSREEILAFVAENPGKAGKREIARAFGLTGAAKIGLKQLLRELAEEGLVEKRHRRLAMPGSLPPVFVANVTGRDADGELLGQPSRWYAEDGPVPAVLIVPDRHRNAPQPGVGDRALVRLGSGNPGEQASHVARIIKILEKEKASILGVIRLKEGDPVARLIPVDRKQKELPIDLGDLNEAKDDDLVAVETTRTGRYGTPKAKVIETIGSMKPEKAISMIALHEYGIRHVFPQAVLDEAERAKPVKPKGREDWRTLPLVTIDPPDAKDHDDAIYAEPDRDEANPDGWIVTVAIADVAAYVLPGSAMDREAHLRGNSVYFPDRVISMLPERISNDLCSLREGEDRPAMAVRMIFAADGRKKSHTFHRVIMRSAAKLAYAQAQDAVDGRTDDKTSPLLDPVLKPLWDAYACLKRGREVREPLDLDLPERKVLLTKGGFVDRVVVPERLDAHKLVEEFMIQANVVVAETLEKRRTPLLYRIHDASSPEKLESLRDFLSTLDIKLPKAGTLRPSHFNGILKHVEDTPNAELVNTVVLRSQAQAEYAPGNIGHFGLNLRCYAHFTSPIRRYSDLIVHRSLIRALDLGDDGLPDGIDGKLKAIGSEISAIERQAMKAERSTIDRLIAHWLCDRIGARFTGRIAGVTKSGLFVQLNETGADGFIPASTLGADYYHYDERSHILVGRTTGETYRLGSRVEVKLVEAAPLAGALRFEMLSEGIKGRPMRGRSGKASLASKQRHRTGKPAGAGRKGKGNVSRNKRRPKS